MEPNEFEGGHTDNPIPEPYNTLVPLEAGGVLLQKSVPRKSGSKQALTGLNCGRERNIILRLWMLIPWYFAFLGSLSIRFRNPERIVCHFIEASDIS